MECEAVTMSEQTRAQQEGAIERKQRDYRLEDPQSIRNYYRLLRWEQNHPQQQAELAYQPRFSVVIPVYNTVTEQLEACFQSVLSQTYDNFELILVDDHSSWDNVCPVLERYAANAHVKVLYRATNGHISAATNDGIAQATGEFIVFMDCDDTIEPDALYEFAKKLNENRSLDFIYSDEDKLTEDGKIRHLPFFKPDWSPDLFLSMLYTNHLAAYRTAIVKAVGGLRTEYDGSQDYDFTLRFMEHSANNRVGHISRVLYHWRERRESAAYAATAKNYATEAARKAKEDYIRRNRIAAHLEFIPEMCQYRVVYEPVGNPLVSIIIPSKDHPAILRQCIDSVRSFTAYPNYEIVVVDNGSSEENRAVIARYLADVDAKYVYEEAPFNFSRMCNLGAANARGDYLLFLNDDIEIIGAHWLERMLGHAQQSHVGAVGAKLLYPQSTLIQHVGVSNLEGGPHHSFQGLDDRSPCYFGLNRVDYDCIAVTGACLLVAESKFREVGGFDESLPVAYNDVKLCFALHSRGYYNVLRNDAVAYHHESLSRGSDDIDDKKLIRLSKERGKLYAAFEELKGADPYFNENLAAFTQELSLRRYYDEVQVMDLSDCVMTDKAGVDSITVRDRIRILGWSVIPEEPHIEDLERYLVFRDPFGKTYGARVLAAERADVAAHFDNKDYLLAGFECVLQKADFRADILPYQMGVLTVDRMGKRHLCWCRHSDVIRSPKPRPYFALPDRKLTDFCLHTGGEDVQWYADECTAREGYHVIRGFAFKRGNDHYCYGKTLILRGSDGSVREYKMHAEERIDVAYTFDREHFLYYTGYLCYVFHTTLDCSREYDVIIRLKNQFDPRDVRDIVTGQKVCL